jgi:hypothetical protein
LFKPTSQQDKAEVKAEVVLILILVIDDAQVIKGLEFVVCRLVWPTAKNRDEKPISLLNENITTIFTASGTNA